MTYQDLYEKAVFDLEQNKITVGEYEERVKPLKAEIRQWIPVSEKLPEDEGWYLVTDDCAGWQWLEAVYCTPGDGIDPFWSVQNPIAWMPLPEPWKGGDSNG